VRDANVFRHHARSVCKFASEGAEGRHEPERQQQNCIEVRRRGGLELLSSSAAVDLPCLHRPFFMKPEDVNAKIEALVKESLA